MSHCSLQRMKINKTKAALYTGILLRSLHSFYHNSFKEALSIFLKQYGLDIQ